VKKVLIALLLALSICAVASCSSDSDKSNEESIAVSENGSTDSSESPSGVESESQSASSSGDVSSQPSNGGNEIDINPDVIQKIPSEFMDISLMNDGNYYLMVQTVRGTESCIKEFAKKGEDVFANTREKDVYQWFLSNGEATFSFDDVAKTYEIYSFSPLFIELFSDKVISNGEGVFFETECKYTRYALNGETSIMHFFRKSDNSWLGFQYMYGEEYEEANIVLSISDSYPDYVTFEIPSDYKYYFETGDNEVSINWD
jgi:hypothetical protein